MADPLATTSDLSDRGVTDGDLDTALAVASSLVRDAAGCDISEETSTVTVTGTRSNLLGLPGPVTAVSSVSVDGFTVAAFTTGPVDGSPVPVSYYRVMPNGLWSRNGWAFCDDISAVTVTYTHGFASVPDDIVDLTCNLAKAWLDHALAGGGSTAGVVSWGVDDASEKFTDEAAAQVSPVFIPEATRAWLGRRFGGGATVVELL